jgi:cytochrome c553
MTLAEHVREIIGTELSESEVAGLATYYAALAAAVAAFATEELRWVEPALRSVPAPIALRPS